MDLATWFSGPFTSIPIVELKTYASSHSGSGCFMVGTTCEQQALLSNRSSPVIAIYQVPDGDCLPWWCSPSLVHWSAWPGCHFLSWNRKWSHNDLAISKISMVKIIEILECLECHNVSSCSKMEVSDGRPQNLCSFHAPYLAYFPGTRGRCCTGVGTQKIHRWLPNHWRESCCLK